MTPPYVLDTLPRYPLDTVKVLKYWKPWFNDWFIVCCLSQRLFRQQTVSSFETIKQRSLKVCHSSAFQTISVRSVYIKIINYSGIIHVLANLNNTLQTKQHATKKTTLIFSYKQDILGSIFCGGRIFVQNLQFLLIQYVAIGTVFNISLLLGMLFFLCAKNIWNRIQIIF